jgi:hypothetical protein
MLNERLMMLFPLGFGDVPARSGCAEAARPAAAEPCRGGAQDRSGRRPLVQPLAALLAALREAPCRR